MYEVIHESLGESGSVVAKGMYEMSGWGVGDSDVKLSLVRRPLEVFTNNLGFRIELVICDYLPSRIIFDDEATFNRRFECFHLKESMIFSKCFMT